MEEKEEEGAAAAADGQGSAERKAGEQQQPQQQQQQQQQAPQRGRTKIVGDYRLESELGKGAYGKVYRATHRVTKQVFALKTISKQFLLTMNNPQVKDYIAREIDILRALDHPNVLKLVETKETKNSLYLCLEFCGGGDLQHFIRRHKRLDEDTARHFTRQLGEGVRYLVSMQVVHRDIKPQNLLLTEFSRSATLKIGDFGFARNADLARTVCGSPLYMAPEIILRRNYGPKIDIWSVGVVLYEMVVGKPPFLGGNRDELETNILHGTCRIPPDLNLSTPLRILLSQLLERNTTRRLDVNGLMESEFLQLTDAERAVAAAAAAAQEAEQQAAAAATGSARGAGDSSIAGSPLLPPEHQQQQQQQHLQGATSGGKPAAATAAAGSGLVEAAAPPPVGAGAVAVAPLPAPTSNRRLSSDSVGRNLPPIAENNELEFATSTAAAAAAAAAALPLPPFALPPQPGTEQQAASSRAAPPLSSAAPESATAAQRAAAAAAQQAALATGAVALPSAGGGAVGAAQPIPAPAQTVMRTQQQQELQPQQQPGTADHQHHEEARLLQFNTAPTTDDDDFVFVDVDDGSDAVRSGKATGTSTSTTQSQPPSQQQQQQQYQQQLQQHQLIMHPQAAAAAGLPPPPPPAAGQTGASPPMAHVGMFVLAGPGSPAQMAMMQQHQQQFGVRPTMVPTTPQESTPADIDRALKEAEYIGSVAVTVVTASDKRVMACRAANPLAFDMLVPGGSSMSTSSGSRSPTPDEAAEVGQKSTSGQQSQQQSQGQQGQLPLSQTNTSSSSGGSRAATPTTMTSEPTPNATPEDQQQQKQQYQQQQQQQQHQQQQHHARRVSHADRFLKLMRPAAMLDTLSTLSLALSLYLRALALSKHAITTVRSPQELGGRFVHRADDLRNLESRLQQHFTRVLSRATQCRERIEALKMYIAAADAHAISKTAPTTTTASTSTSTGTHPAPATGSPGDAGGVSGDTGTLDGGHSGPGVVAASTTGAGSGPTPMSVPLRVANAAPTAATAAAAIPGSTGSSPSSVSASWLSSNALPTSNAEAALYEDAVAIGTEATVFETIGHLEQAVDKYVAARQLLESVLFGTVMTDEDTTIIHAYIHSFNTRIAQVHAALVQRSPLVRHSRSGGSGGLSASTHSATGGGADAGLPARGRTRRAISTPDNPRPGAHGPPFQP